MARELNNKRQNVRLQQLEKRREHDDDEALKLVMQAEDGRRVLSRLARDCGWMGDGWDSTSARQTDFNAGKRSAATQFMAWAERVAPAEFLTAIGEATRRDVEMAQLAQAAIIEKDEDDNG